MPLLHLSRSCASTLLKPSCPLPHTPSKSSCFCLYSYCPQQPFLCTSSPNHQHSFAPHDQTTSVCHASHAPPPPQYPTAPTSPGISVYASVSLHTSTSPSSFPFFPTAVSH